MSLIVVPTSHAPTRGRVGVKLLGSQGPKIGDGWEIHIDTAPILVGRSAILGYTDDGLLLWFTTADLSIISYLSPGPCKCEKMTDINRDMR